MNRVIKSVLAVVTLMFLGACAARKNDNNAFHSPSIQTHNTAQTSQLTKEKPFYTIHSPKRPQSLKQTEGASSSSVCAPGLGWMGDNVPVSTSSYSTSDGIHVTPILDPRPNIYAEMLAATYWRFKIITPSMRKNFRVDFYLTGSLLSMNFSSSVINQNNTDYELTIVMAPMGDNWQKSNKMKIVSILESVSPDHKTDKRVKDAVTIANAYKNVNCMGSENPMRMNKDGYIHLFSGCIMPAAQKPQGLAFSKSVPQPVNIDLIMRIMPI